MHFDGDRPTTKELERSELLRPMLVVKNAVALWSLPDPPDDGPLLAESWPSLRRRFLIHNPAWVVYSSCSTAPSSPTNSDRQEAICVRSTAVSQLPILRWAAEAVSALTHLASPKFRAA